MRLGFYLRPLLAAIIMFVFTVPAFSADTLKAIEKKNLELSEKEASLKKEEERIAALRRDLEEAIAKYEKLLAEIEGALNDVEEARAGNVKQLIKTYEAMPAESAAERLSALPEETAVKILVGMNSRKAGAAMAAMSTSKAASLTGSMERIVKNIPSK